MWLRWHSVQYEAIVVSAGIASMLEGGGGQVTVGHSVFKIVNSITWATFDSCIF